MREFEKALAVLGLSLAASKCHNAVMEPGGIISEVFRRTNRLSVSV